MAIGILMPKQGITVESCIITTWVKKVGDTVAVGDILFTYETDKASFECESTESGTLLEIFFHDGDDVPVLINVCAIGKPGEDVSALRPEGAAAAAAPVAAVAVTTAAAAPVTATAPVATAAAGEIKLSPRARMAAEKLGVDPRLATATGPYGRIIERDITAAGANFTKAAGDAVLSADKGAYAASGFGGRIGVGDTQAPAAVAAAPAAASGAAYEDIKMSGIRKSIAKAMTSSLATMAQLTHQSSFDATEVMAFRAKLKANGEAMGMGNITLNDIILYAVSRVLKNHPDLNANMIDENTLRRFSAVNLGVAVDTAKGLMVPTLFDADSKSLSQISAEAKTLAKEAQGGSINPDKLRGGTFTVTNLGTLGVEAFTPVINPPQTGILGVCNLQTKVREVNGEIKTYQAMGLSLTFDHRAVDGAPAARFLKDLCNALENFSLLLAR